MDQKTNQHPYHFSPIKNFTQRIIDWVLPIGLFLVYFLFYNHGKVTPSEMIKTTGLVAIALLSFTLIAGPIGRFVPRLNILKAHREFWGISSFVFALLHFILVFIFDFKINLVNLFNQNDPKFYGFLLGLSAAIILLTLTILSLRFIIRQMDPHLWKAIQLTAYVALLLAIVHFYLVEQVNGALVIKRLLGRVTYWFTFIALGLRILVLLFPKKKSPDPVD